jgi:hypothetical protein
MSWTIRDTVKYNGFKEVSLYTDNNNNLMMVADVGLEKVHVVTEGTYLSISINGDQTRYFARSVSNPNGQIPYKIYVEDRR